MNHPVSGPGGQACSTPLVARDLRLLWPNSPQWTVDTPRDDPVKNNLLIENWVTRISLQYVVEIITQVYINKNFQRKIVNIFLPIIFSICFGCSKEPSH